MLFNPLTVTEITRETLRGRARNTPYLGRRLAGRVELVALGEDFLVDRL